MLRLLSLPFALLLGVVSFGLIGTGVSMLGEAESGGDEGGSLDLGPIKVSGGNGDDQADSSAAIAGGSLVGFGVIGLIGAVALGIVALSRRRDDRPPGGGQQQQQQVVIVTDGNARVETRGPQR